MDAILRAGYIYVFLLVFVRLSGKRLFAEITVFDFILLLIISETTQQGMLGSDFSLTKASLLIFTLLFLDIVMSLVTGSSRRFDRWINGTPLILVENGRVLEERLKKSRVEREDILEAARRLRGLERMEQIKFAILERNGGISVVPFERNRENG